jgi:hypothetical protein
MKMSEKSFYWSKHPKQQVSMTTVPGTDWIEYFDQNHQRKYFYHPITKETTWQLPKSAKKATKKILENLEPGEKLDLTPKYKDNVQPPKIPLSPRGEEHFSPRKISGLKEILSPRDKAKNETKEEIKGLEDFSIKIPNGETIIKVESPAEDEEITKQRRKSRKEKLMSDDLTLDAPETEKDGWLECTQEGTQKKYYYNVKSKRTTWMKPSGPQNKSVKDLLESESSDLKKKRSQSALMGSGDDFIPMKLLSPRSDGGSSLQGLNTEIVLVDGETQPRRNSESVYTEAKKIHFYNEQGKSFAYDTSLQDILSNVDLTFLEVLNVSGNYSLKEYAKNNFRKQKEKVFIFKREMTPDAAVTWQKGVLKTTLHSFKEEKDEKAALKLYQSFVSFFNTNLSGDSIHRKS